MEQKTKPRIGITIGDIAGIGLEVALKALADNRVLHYCTPIIYGSASVVNRYRKLLALENFSFHQVQAFDQLHPKKVNVLNCLEEELEFTPGVPSPATGALARAALLRAAQDLKEGHIQAVVTAPIDKDNTQGEGFQFPGHTEFFTTYFNAPESLMFLVADGLRVATLTGHIPLKEVASRLTADLLIRKLTILDNSLRKDFSIQKPKIAVLGLNPHAGENGLLGTEETEIVLPVIEQFKNKGNLVFGPFPADGFFGTRSFQKFDATLALYHDQGLIPFKTLAFERGVNFTAGLPIVRTSPDHGTAYDIAGQNKADETSFREALFAAIDILRARAGV
ncbi:4-hydroxythreonine-4-phosphate dehydrogenase PdxA [Rufibacter glacialis]|uniref:4-hydroxythreonine-4-phosphate dehydrogenase PdxA n=1 Tax=Rufibacter glacialis TaxID=1259555 RepID=A0A5M8QF74_9BACT|nr:4-hydroxythreonine-4-phosphate dehydrogenase PdxA [Rufibacter glacialis]KAA6434659.1 4-hydroxythreonine-4-phosphate dehydrogenase PdxA [Rufibacter glacialis]GGK71413.1 4-hydroxythreonine-4-phosphate dehydrogenase [Rufibacter glacialis]